jgi:hypothetical protein
MPDKPRPDHFLVSDSNLRPEDLFNTYFYGDFLHVGDNCLVQLNIARDAPRLLGFAI